MPVARKFAVSMITVLAGGLLAAATNVQSAPAGSLSAQDQQFLTRAMHGAMLQSELGKVAAAQGENPRVRELATLGVQNFSKAEDTLRSTAQQFQLRLEPGVPQDVAALRRALANDRGPVLDGEFIGQSLPANTVAVNLFSSEIRNGSNPVLVQFARNTLPQLEQRQASLLRLTFDMGGLIAGAEPNPPMKLPEYMAPPNPTAKAEELSHG